jgi:hypothetical protein
MGLAGIWAGVWELGTNWKGAQEFHAESRKYIM